MSGETFNKIYTVVKSIPRGRVLTYGQVAALAGNPRWARVVGYALHANPDPASIPCHRVVNREGRLAEAFVFGGRNEQEARLVREGVATLADGTVDLKLYNATYEEMCKSLSRGVNNV